MEDNYTFNVDIETQKSTTSVASLRKEVKDLKDQLLNLEQGTEDYNRVLQECADKTHALKEMNEELRASAADAGEKLGNISRTLAGVSGGVQVVTSGLSLMGVEMGKDNELMKTLVSLMSMTQGLQAIDSGVKAFARLTRGTKMATVAQQGLNLAVKAFPAVMVFTAAVSALNAFIGKQKEYQELQIEKQQEAFNRELEETNKRHAQEISDIDFLVQLYEAEGHSILEVAKYRRTLLETQRTAYLAEHKLAAQQLSDLYDIKAELTDINRESWGWIHRFGNLFSGKGWKLDVEVDLDDINRQIDNANKKWEQAEDNLENIEDLIKKTDQAIQIAEKREETAERKRHEQKLKNLKAEREEQLKTLEDIKDETRGWQQYFRSLAQAFKAAGNEDAATYWDNFTRGMNAWEIPSALLEHIKNDLAVGTLVLGNPQDMGKIWKAFLDGREGHLKALEQQQKAYIEELKANGATVAEVDKTLHDQEIARLIIVQEYQESYLEWAKTYYKNMTAEKQAELQAEIDATKNQITNLENYYAAKQQLLQGERNYEEASLTQELDFMAQTYKAQNDILVNATSLYNLEREQEKKALADKIAFYEAQIELLEQFKQQSSDEYVDYVEKLREARAEEQRLLAQSRGWWDEWGSSVKSVLGNVTDVMSSLMSYYQTQTDEAVADLEDQLKQNIINQEEYDKQSEKLKEEQFERNKNFQLAQAYVNGAAGIVQIIGDSSLPSYWAKLAAIAATIATTGIEIAAIKAQHYHPSGSGGGGNNNPGSGENWINVAPAYQMNDGTNATTDRLDQISSNQTSQRVYILESDIQSSNRRVQVRESNTRF